jgi:hypothetical protein
MVTTGKIARRSARAATGRKTSDKSGRMTTEWRTAGETRRWTTGTDARRRTGKRGRRTRGRAELSEHGIWRDERGAEHCGGRQH